ncbi:Y-family DNA polymerase [Paenisporosarcina antarctica]|uniref:UV damage repair protein UvrX n=1 Tax=Paenisporosarcina antarctica TaxID=417367 RepID=A0A4P7A389_9BACL|nr:UV damage repair protein UvrX [Paenisporosarcina antarctica]QBP43188.1 UV damage repair protein UvrX [Paenisporosarcina antarctica]
MYENMPNKQVACIDMKSFYASCAAADQGLDVLKTPIAVVGNLERKGSIVLAASPLMKKMGVKTGTRLYEIPDHPSNVLIEPKMDFFVRISMEIARLLGEYVPKEAIHVYSIDEIFFDLKGTEHIWGPIETTIKRIQDELMELFQLPSAVGMGPNMLMSKLALDLEAKKTGFAKWEFQDVPTKLWPISPLSDMWGIGSRTEKTLNSMGIFSVGDLAHTDLNVLEEKFGIMGNQLYHHAWGIDLSEMGAPLIEGQVSYGKGQILYRDYNTKKDVMAVVLEMCEDIARRTREAGKAGRTVSLSIGYSKDAFGGGFSRSRSIVEGTNDTMKIYRVCNELFDEFYDGRPTRQISVSISKLEDENSMQLSLFEANKWRNRKLGSAMDAIRSKYGSTALLRAVSYTDAGTARQRDKLIGGHKAE